MGRETLLTAVAGLPATPGPVPTTEVSGPAAACASGGVPGHIGTWTYPGSGCQPLVCARTPLDANVITAKTDAQRKDLMDFITAPWNHKWIHDVTIPTETRAWQIPGDA
ncbi:MAG TPA: hypothetical protein VMF66_03790 [Candidatus Acidoferrum sp.]|nr:hypothetical protein [Candidatus Acidoferrum sp.]